MKNFLSHHEKIWRVSRLENSSIPNCHLSFQTFFPYFWAMFFIWFRDWRLKWKPNVAPFRNCYFSIRVLLHRLMNQVCENAKQLQKNRFLSRKTRRTIFCDPSINEQNLAPGHRRQNKSIKYGKHCKICRMAFSCITPSIFSSQKLRRQYIANKMQIASKSFGGTTWKGKNHCDMRHQGRSCPSS